MLIPWLQSFLPGKKPPQYTPLRNWGPLCHTGVRMGRRWMGKRWISTTSDTSTRNMERRKKILSNSFDIPCRHTYIKRSPFLPYCTPECIISLRASLANKGRAALWARAHCRTGVKSTAQTWSSQILIKVGKKTTHKKQLQTQELWPTRGTPEVLHVPNKLGTDSHENPEASPVQFTFPRLSLKGRCK